MKLGLAGRVALVTGAGQGVGRRIAIELGEEGCAVAVNDLHRARAEAVAAEIRTSGARALACMADITDAAQVDRMCAEARDALGPISILVNNAGVPAAAREPGAKRPRFVDSDLQSQHRFVDLNVHGTLHCCRAALPDMIDQRWGRIINMISEAGRVGEARLAVYSGAKAAILGFTMALAREHGRDCINVNAVALGAISHEGILEGPLRPGAAPATDERLARMLEAYPLGKGLGRAGSPEDAAGLVAFLASDRAAYITGQSIGVSGGFHMQ